MNGLVERHALEGRRVPSVVFKTRIRDEAIAGPNPFRWQDLSSDELFAGRRVVAFSVPGAFTPTCSNEQCPAYERCYDAFLATGVDEVVCLAVNDAFVMHQWRNRLGVERLRFVPDGSGHFTRALDMLVPRHDFGFGDRSWRYAMVVDDGVIVAFFEEPGRADPSEGEDPYGISDPDMVLKWLRGGHARTVDAKVVKSGAGPSASDVVVASSAPTASPARSC